MMARYTPSLPFEGFEYSLHGCPGQPREKRDAASVMMCRYCWNPHRFGSPSDAASRQKSAGDEERQNLELSGKQLTREYVILYIPHELYIELFHY